MDLGLRVGQHRKEVYLWTYPGLEFQQDSDLVCLMEHHPLQPQLCSTHFSVLCQRMSSCEQHLSGDRL